MKTRNVLFKLDIAGNGIVNYDTNDQKYVHNDAHTHLKSRYNNTLYSKKNFYGEGDNLRFKIKISSDCLRHSLFDDELISQSPKIISDKRALYSFMASPMSVLRGYMFANKEETLKRSGGFHIIDAEQTNDAFSYMELFSKSGERVSKELTTDTSDTSLFFKETVGNITYATQGSVDLRQLQFISCDQVYDRYSFNPDPVNFDLYKKFMRLRLKNFNSNLEYYQLINFKSPDEPVMDIPEFGFKFSNENVNDLVKYMVEKLLLLNIERSKSFARKSKLMIKFVTDPLIHTFESENDWVEVNSMNDVNNISFEMEDFYSLVDRSIAETKRNKIEQVISDKKKETSDKKKEADKLKKEKKENEVSNS
jgi:hypothetical protein